MQMKRRIISALVAMMLIVSVLAVPGASAATKVKILKVTVDGARVRKGPASTYDVKTSVKKGGKVFYLGKTTNSFAYVRTSSGTVGYMYEGYLKSYGTCYKSQVYYSKKNKVPVYKKKGGHGKRVTRLSKKQHVIVYQVKGKWAYIKTLGGTGGYVRKSYLKKAS